MRAARVSRIPVLAAISLLGSAGFLVAQAGDPAKEKRDLMVILVREALVPELEKTPLKAETSGRQTTRIKTPFGLPDIVDHKDWSVSVDGTFVDPVKQLQVEVTRLDPAGPGAKTVSMKASVPVSGEIWGELQGYGKTKVKFKARADLRLTGTIRRKAKASNEFMAEIAEWDGHFEGVTIEPDLFGILSGEARNAANKAIADKNEHLKGEANKALVKAATDCRLKIGD